MAEINIPTGPIEAEPYDAILTAPGESLSAACRTALLRELGGMEFGTYDDTILAWLADWEPSTVATVCSWLRRVREVPSESSGPRILAAVAQAITDLGDTPHGRVIMAAAVLAYQQPELTAQQAVETAATDTTGEPVRAAWAEGRRLLTVAAEQPDLPLEGEGSPAQELTEQKRQALIDSGELPGPEGRCMTKKARDAMAYVRARLEGRNPTEQPDGGDR